jgi:hypothetical protein
MSQVMVRYRVKPEAAARNEELIRGVFEELARENPAGIEYAVYVLDDGVTFVHIADAEGLTDRPAFRAFAAGHADRCEEPPVVMRWREVGSFSP